MFFLEVAPRVSVCCGENINFQELSLLLTWNLTPCKTNTRASSCKFTRFEIKSWSIIAIYYVWKSQETKFWTCCSLNRTARNCTRCYHSFTFIASFMLRKDYWQIFRSIMATYKYYVIMPCKWGMVCLFYNNFLNLFIYLFICLFIYSFIYLFFIYFNSITAEQRSHVSFFSYLSLCVCPPSRLFVSIFFCSLTLFHTGF